jgi:hypothetical protein
MKTADFGRCTLGICVAVAMLAGCGGSPPIGAPGAMLQASAISAPATHGKSWMLPEAKNEELLYVSGGNGAVTIYSYKTRKLVGTLSGFNEPEGLCSNVYGDVFVVDYGSYKIYEYRHGGTKVISTLSSGGASFSCAVDPTTGNLAVTNGGILGGGDLVVFKQAQGTPKAYSAPGFLSDFWWCAYDNNGNLFADGVSGVSDGPTPELVELHRHAKSLVDIPLNEGPYSPLGAVLWDGRFLALEGSISKYGFARLKIKRDQWTQHGDGVYLAGAALGFEFAIVPAYGGKRRVLIESNSDYSGSYSLGYWDYPSGGKPFATITDGISGAAVGVTVSAVR